MHRRLKILWIVLGILCGQYAMVLGQTLKGSSWQQVKTAKKGKIIVVFANHEPFIYLKDRKNGPVIGVEHDLIQAFVSFLKSKYQVDLTVEWKWFRSFNDCYIAAKNATQGVIGSAGISITDERKKEMQFSPAYMPDIEIVVSSQNVPLYNQISDFANAIPDLRAITVKNTTYEKNFKSLKNKIFPNLKYTYVSDGKTLLDSCVVYDNYWGYTSLPSYIIAMQQGKSIHRQHFFNVVRQGMAFAFPLTADWKEPIDDFFEQPGFQELVNQVINKHFGSFAADLIVDASRSSVNESKETQITTAEKKLQELRIRQQQKEIQQKKSQTRNAYIVLTIFLLLAGLTIWFFYNREKIKKKARRELAQKNEEIAAQSEHLKESYQRLELISEIGKHIIANLSVEDIIETVYTHVLALMPTEEFGIGIFDEHTQSLVYEIYFYKGERAPIISVPVNNHNRLAIQCFSFKKEIILADIHQEYKRYIESLEGYKQDDLLASMICLPLIVGQQAIGIISVQHSKKNSYSDHHVSILRNLAIYTTIAIQNAQVFRQMALQKKEIEQQKNSITASIDYAKQIQDAMLPSSEEISRHLPNSFIFFKPRDIVSGDFYYFAADKATSKLILAAVDCTGHGVPGAFMSLIGNDVLNSIVEQEGVVAADIILNRLHHGVRQVLKQYDTSNRDGMDIALCVIDQKAKTLEFAGAMSSLVYIQQGELQRVVGDKTPIGGEQREKNRKFQKHTINIQQPTTFYIYSDGFQDQFGGEYNQKFMAPRFRKLLFDRHHLPMAEQKEALNVALQNWQQGTDQLDDILVIGVQV